MARYPMPGALGGPKKQSMEVFEEHLPHPAQFDNDTAGEPCTSLHEAFPEHDGEAADSDSTCDLVRVYLREMGAVRLLKRQDEIVRYSGS